MPSIDFEVWCGVCGSGVCRDTEVEGTKLTVTCRTCKEELADAKETKEEAEQSLEEAMEQIAELQKELIAKVEEYEGRLAAISYGYSNGIDTSIG